MKNDCAIPRLISHRGASDFAPENTLAALQKAHDLGSTWVEFDVALTGDDEAVIFHDESLERITGVTKLLATTSFSEVKTLDAGSWFSKEFSNERIPSLKEWLRLAASLSMGINLEMKVNGKASAEKLAASIAAHLSDFWHDGLTTPLISSFDTECLEAIHNNKVKAQFAYNIDKWSPFVIRLLNKFDCVSLHANYKILTKRRIAKIKATGRKVLAYTVQDKKIAERLFSMGVDAIFSNNPLLLV